MGDNHVTSTVSRRLDEREPCLEQRTQQQGTVAAAAVSRCAETPTHLARSVEAAGSGAC